MIIIGLLKFAVYPLMLICASYLGMRIIARIFNIKDESFIVKGSSTYLKKVDVSIQETIRLVNWRVS